MLSEYQRHQVDGVEVYLPHNLMLNAPALTFSLGGFWRLRWLKVEGVALAAACSI